MADVPPFRQAVNALKPGASGSQAAALLANRVSREVANHWLAGRRHAPRWALQFLASQIRERIAELATVAEIAEQTKDRPGKKAGAFNLARWLAQRHDVER